MVTIPTELPSPQTEKILFNIKRKKYIFFCMVTIPTELPSPQTENVLFKINSKKNIYFCLAFVTCTNALTTQQAEVLQITTNSTHRDVDIYLRRKGNRYG